MNVYDFQEVERQGGQLKRMLSDEAIDINMSNALIKEQFSEFFHRQYGAVLGAVASDDPENLRKHGKKNRSSCGRNCIMEKT